jgi:hypothetical protein
MKDDVSLCFLTQIYFEIGRNTKKLQSYSNARFDVSFPVPFGSIAWDISLYTYCIVCQYVQHKPTKI